MSVFADQCCGKIDVGDVGDGRKPRDHVRKFLCQVLSIISTECRREFADFLHQPHKGPVDASGNVFLIVHISDMPLEIAEGQIVLSVGIAMRQAIRW